MLYLYQVGSEQGVGDEGARQLPVLDVVLDLETHVVPGQVLLKLGWLGRVELHLETKTKNIYSSESIIYLFRFKN